jgi:hypothetical protein
MRLREEPKNEEEEAEGAARREASKGRRSQKMRLREEPKDETA